MINLSNLKYILCKNDKTTKYLVDQSEFFIHEESKLSRIRAFICTSLIITSIPTFTEASKFYYKDIYSNPSLVKPIEYSIDTIDNSILSNNNLTKDEKAFFLANLDILNDNSKYVNMNWLKLVLKDLKIIYTNDRSNYNATNTLNGFYNYKTNDIILFDCTCFSDCNKDVLLHEFFHCTTKRETNKGQGLMEAVNETLTSEYDNQEYLKNRSYQLQNAILYSLCEIIGPEVFIEYHFNNNIDTIKDELVKIINDQNLADSLIKRIDNIYINCITIVNTQSDDSYREFVNNLREIYTIVKSYYETKYNEPFEDNKEIMLYMDNFCFRDTSKKTNYDIICKGYFNPDYIENHKNSKDISELYQKYVK